jgi:hypothetical protein
MTTLAHGPDDGRYEIPAVAPAAVPPVLASIEIPPIATADALARRQLARIGGAAFAVVALVLGWRAATTVHAPAAAEVSAVRAVPPLPIEVEVTVLDVHGVAAAPAAAAPAAAAPDPAPPPASLEPSRTPPPAIRPPRPRSPARPAPPQVKPPEPRPAPQPATESNPYVYK